MKLHYRRTGEGQPLVILHGVFGSSDNWQTLGRKLSEHFAVYLVDLRNHGHSPHSDTFDIPSMAGDVHELFQDEELENVILVGHSMGGKVAMHFALDHPEFLERLMVVDIAPKQYPMRHQAILDAMTSVDLETLSSRKEVDKALEESIPETAIRQFLLKNLYRPKKDRFGWRVNLPVLKEQFSNINAPLATHHPAELPVLFLRGGRSDYVSEEDLPAIHELFPNASLETIEASGHWIHAETPNEFMDHLLSFAGKA